MKQLPITRLLVAIAMLLSIVGGPAVASGNGNLISKQQCCRMRCCMVKEKLPAERQPIPVQQRVGHELAAAVTAAPFSVLFTFGPTEAKRAPRALFATGHAPAPLAASCIRLI